jgi:hypothetical protein
MFIYVYVEVRQFAVVFFSMYIVIKIIKGRQYRYQQRSYREGTRVRTETIYLGPVGGGIRLEAVPAAPGKSMMSNRVRQRGRSDEEKTFKRYDVDDDKEFPSREMSVAELQPHSNAQSDTSTPGIAEKSEAEIAEVGEASDNDAPSGAEAGDGAEGQ